jgi:hypothetical protein
VLVVKAVGPRAGTPGGHAAPPVPAVEGAGTLAPGQRLVALGERRSRRLAGEDA